MSLAHQRIVVTGTSRGIGAALTRGLAASGAHVVLVARDADAIGKLAADVGGEAFAADLSDAAAIEPLVGSIEAAGSIDVLVNNAGVDLTGAITSLRSDQIQQLIAVNLVAPILLCRAVIPGMHRRGGGHIVNVSSIGGTNALPGVAPYGASKAGLSHFTAGLRAELKGTHVTTTLAEIGPVRSDMMDSLRAHPPTARALKRLEHLRLVADLDMDAVVDNLVSAIERRRRHVRMPKRNAVFPMLAEAPRRITEWLLVGTRPA